MLENGGLYQAEDGAGEDVADHDQGPGGHGAVMVRIMQGGIRTEESLHIWFT